MFSDPVQFRTKCSRNMRPGRPFHRDSIREIICNPFYVGLVVRRPYPALDMDDDQAPGMAGNLSSRKPKKLPDGMSRRSILEMHRGRHEGIVPLGLWQANQQERQRRGNTPVNSNRVIREYLLSGVGFCWECHNWDGRQASLRGISGNKYPYYRCSTVQGEYKMRNNPHPEVFSKTLDTLCLDAE